MRDIRVASVQFEHKNGDKACNLSRIEDFSNRAAGEGVELVVFPECCITGYWFLRRLSRPELLELAEPIFTGPSARFLRQLSGDLHLTIGAGLIEMDDSGRLYNSYLVVMPDGAMVRHRKIHCFISEYMESGNEFTVFDSPHECRIGILTCYDNNIVENVRITGLKGAEILLAPHQTGGCKSISPRGMKPIDVELWHNRESDPAALKAKLLGPDGREWLMRWLPARAHDNGLFLIFSNGIGVDDGEIRTGNAMIIDPYGQIITETCKAGDDMVIADLEATLRTDCTGLRWNMSRRPELYGPLTVPTGSEKAIRKVRFGGYQ